MKKSGARNGGPWTAWFAEGDFDIAYRVEETQGKSCSWVLWVTDADGLETIGATSYPLDEPDVDTDTLYVDTSAVLPVRVESDCPGWTFSIRQAAP